MSIIRFCKVWQISTKEPTLRAEADSVMPECGPKSPDSPNPVSHGALPSGEVVFWAHAALAGGLFCWAGVAPPDSESPATLSASARSVSMTVQFRRGPRRLVYGQVQAADDLCYRQMGSGP